MKTHAPSCSLKLRPVRTAVLLSTIVTLLVLCATAAQAVELTVTDDLELWLDASNAGSLNGGTIADGQSVSAWNDTSTAAHNAAQGDTNRQPIWVESVPELGGRSAVRFDGSSSSGQGDRMGITSPLSLGMNVTAFVVAKDTMQTSGGSCCRPLLSENSSSLNGNGIGFGFNANDNGNDFHVYRGDAGNSLQTPLPTSPDEQFHVYSVAYTSADMSLHEDSTFVASRNDTFAFTGTAYTVGGNVNSNARHYQGDIAEMLVYDQALDASQKLQVEGYLAAKYGMVTTEDVRQGLLLYSPMDDAYVNRGGTNPPPALSTDDGNWTVEDHTSVPHNGTAIADNTGGQVTSSATGQIGQAIDFSDAVAGNRRVDYGDVLDVGAGENRTVSLWFNSRDSDQTVFIASDGNGGSTADGWSVWLEGSGSGRLMVRADYAGSLTTENLGLNRPFTAAEEDAWHHLALIIDNDTGLLSAYFDGLASGTSGTENGWGLGGGGAETNVFTPGQDFSNTQPLLLGLRNDLAAEWAGMIDDFAMWDRVLSEQEIAAIYAVGLSGASLMAVPEPSTWVLLGMGSLCLLGSAWRRRARRSRAG